MVVSSEENEDEDEVGDGGEMGLVGSSSGQVGEGVDGGGQSSYFGDWGERDLDLEIERASASGLVRHGMDVGWEEEKIRMMEVELALQQDCCG